MLLSLLSALLLTVSPLGEFVPEQEMMQGLLQSLARFSQYMVEDYTPCEKPNRRAEPCGCFKARKTMTSYEDGVRTNADLSMLCAFLVRYARPLGTKLPKGVSYDRLERMAMESLVYAYSTHKAVRLKRCADGHYWGSRRVRGAVWESSLWAFSVAWSAFFQWDKLSAKQKKNIYRLLKAECNYELRRKVPTGYLRDTKAEENGWEACVLAAATGLFPDDRLAPKWFERMREFAINSYSHPSDTLSRTPIDGWYDETSVADLYKGANLYEDHTLQNHKFFHTSYQNVVMQELGEAALALRLFQTGLGREERWRSNALLHNMAAVMENVLAILALPDGELAMPNGNDWSLFLFDQITSYSTVATLLKDPDALMLENLAFKNILARQATTPDGSWLLRSDIGARRMGVQGHRVMMTWLMHHANSTDGLTPTEWEHFRERHSEAKLLPCQDVIRAFPPARFVSFSYSEGLRNYSGYIAPNDPDKCKVFVPFRHGGCGNFIGWYDVEGRKTDAVATTDPFFSLEGDSFVTSCTLHTNEGSLENSFALYATPGNAVLYLDDVSALADVTVTAERGIVAGISVDEFTGTDRTIACAEGQDTLDGSELTLLQGNWVNIDGQIGILSRGGSQMAFGDREDNNSILTARFYGSFDDGKRDFVQGSTVGSRTGVYYTGISPDQTAGLNSKVLPLGQGNGLPEGWKGCVASDPDGAAYLLTAHFKGECAEAPVKVRIDAASYPGAPVFTEETFISKKDGILSGESRIRLEPGQAAGRSTRFFLQGNEVYARQDPSDGQAIYIRSPKGARPVSVCYMPEQGPAVRKSIFLDGAIRLRYQNGRLVSE